MKRPGRGPLAAGIGMFAVGVGAVALVSIGGRAPGRPSSGAGTAVVQEGRFRDVVVLDGAVTAPAQTPLVLTNPTSEFEWAVESGRTVRRGTVLFVEHAPVAGAPLAGLEASFAAAEEQVTSTRIAARRSVAIARRAVRHSAPGEERTAAKADLNRVLAGASERISSALQRQAQLVAPSSAPTTRTVLHRAPDDGIVRRGGGAGEAQGVVGTLEGAEYTVRSPLDPLLLYRFRGAPHRARVTIPGGPPTFRCPDVDVHFRSDQGVAATPESSAAPPTPAEPGATLTCAVPPDVRVFPGLRAVVRLTASTRHHALTIPARAVQTQGRSKGTVMLSRGGVWIRREVVLGPSDGARVVVEEGLNAGQTVLLDPAPPSPAS